MSRIQVPAPVPGLYKLLYSHSVTDSVQEIKEETTKTANTHSAGRRCLYSCLIAVIAALRLLAFPAAVGAEGAVAATPTITTKRITLDPPKGSVFNNYGTLFNSGLVLPATVALNDDTSLGALSVPGNHPELFSFNNEGTVVMGQSIVAIIQTADGVRIVFYADSTFLATAADGTHAGGTYAVEGGRLVFTLTDGTVAEPVTAENGDAGYTLGEMKFVLTAEFIARVEDSFRAWKSQVIPAIYNY